MRTEKEQIPCRSSWEMANSPTKIQGSPIIPDTWTDRRRAYPKILARLEHTAGPDADLDKDINWLVESRPPVRFTSSIEEVETYVARANLHWRRQNEPHIDAWILEDENAEPRESAWLDGFGRPQMKKPPANEAIALSLAMLRDLGETYG